MTKSLIGKWKLVKDGSDFLPGLDSLSELPLVNKLLGNQEVEFFKIEKKNYIDVEEIQFSYASKSSSISRSYQLGTINFEHVHANDVIIASVQNCAESFTEVIVSRLGPRTGQNSREHYQLDPARDVIKLTIDITTSEGTVIKMIKFLARFDTSATENIKFELAARSNGWRIHDYWPSTVISSVEMKIIKAVKIKSLNPLTNEPTRVIEDLWSSADDAIDGEVEWNTTTRCFSGKSNENDEFVEFIIKVKLDGVVWYVARRYNEFDALRHFLLTQNPHNSDFQTANSRFPGKALVFRKSVLDARLRGLDEFLRFYLTNARYCRQNALDALCFFLQIPEQSYFAAKGSVQLNSRGISTILPSQPSSPSVPSTSSIAVADSPKFLAAPGVDQIPTQSKATAQAIKVPEDKKVVAKNSQPLPDTRTSSIDNSKKADVKATASVAKAEPAPSKAAATSVVAPSASQPAPKMDTVPVPAKTVPTLAVTPVLMQITQNEMSELSDDRNLCRAQQQLLDVLGEGMQIIKHGRQGAPKHRLLRCNRQATELFIQADDHRKTLKLSEVESIRLGTEVDPITSQEALRSLNDTSSETGRKTSVLRRASMSIRGINDSHVYYGTATLRRTCKADDMRFCISLIMPDRTFDIQCKTVEDVELLQRVLVDACKEAKK